MKAAELRKKDKKELEKSVYDLKKELSDFRFKSSASKISGKMGDKKREIARILTILNEKKV